MKTLDQHCQSFHQALFSDQDLSPQQIESLIPAGKLSLVEAFQVYREGYFARATEALGEIYETLWMFLGDDLFFGEVQAYATQNPSRFQNLYHWGQGFPDFIKERNIDLRAFDLAKFCWLHHEVFHRGPRLVSISNLPKFQFQTHFEIFSSRFNIPALWTAIRSDSEFPADVDQATQTVIFLKASTLQFAPLNIDSDFLLALQTLAGQGNLDLDQLFESLPQEATEGSQAAEEIQNLFKHLSELGLFIEAPTS